MNPIAMAVILAVTLSLFAWSAFRRFQLARTGAKEPSFDLSREGELAARVEHFMVYWLGQK